MPKGTKRPDTKEIRLAKKDDAARKDFYDNRDKMDKARKKSSVANPAAAIEAFIRMYKDSGKYDKMSKAAEAARKGPKGIKSKSVYSKDFGSAVGTAGKNWREVGQVAKDKKGKPVYRAK